MTDTHTPPKIERGIPDQNGTPGFYLTLPMVATDRFTEALHAIVPDADLAWSAKPPAWWIAERHLESVRSLTLAFFGEALEIDELGPTFWIAKKERPA